MLSPLNTPTGKDKLIFVHGFLGSREDWLEIKKDLSDTFDLWALELPGHGQTPLQDSHCNIKELCRLVYTELQNILEETPAHFWGYSMGGRLCLQLATAYPEIFKTLTLESVSLGLKSSQERTHRLQQDQHWAFLIEENFERFLQDWYSQDLFKSFRESQSFTQTLLKRTQSNPSQIAQALKSFSPGQWPYFEGPLQLPVLVLLGEKDLKYRQLWAKPVDSLKDCTIKIVSDSGHVIHLENPKACTKEFLEFYKQR